MNNIPELLNDVPDGVCINMQTATLVSNDELRVLIECHDEWAGSHHPDYREDFLAEFKQLKLHLQKQGYVFNNPCI